MAGTKSQSLLKQKRAKKGATGKRIGRVRHQPALKQNSRHKVHKDLSSEAGVLLRKCGRSQGAAGAAEG